MSSSELILAALNVFQFVALAWIAAWQQRAAYELRRANGTMTAALAEAGVMLPERNVNDP